jgi:multidrug efflux system membrane fusion protein
VKWIVVLALGSTATYYRADWLPRVKTWLDPWITKTNVPVVKPARVVPVVTASTRNGDMDLYLNGLGTVTAFKTVTIKSRVEGELVEVAFTEGQMVSEGDLLARIDPRPFNVQLAQAEGQLARDEASLKVNELTLARYEGLRSSKAVTPQQVDEQVALVQQSEGAIKTDKAMIANARLQLTYSHIVAPISGRIGLRLVDLGNIVRANDPTGLAVITQLQPIALVFTIPQDSVNRVQKKFKASESLSVEAYDRDFGTKLATGTLLAIDNQVDSTTGTVRLKAVFENEDNMLFPNQFVNARLLVDVKRDAVIVPAAAVQQGPNGTFVYVVTADGTDQSVKLRNVVAGATEGDQTVIEEGLSQGEVVVTDGVDKLIDGAKVAPRERNASADEAMQKPATETRRGGDKETRKGGETETRRLESPRRRDSVSPRRLSSLHLPT